MAMIQNKILAGLCYMLAFSLCSVPAKNAGTTSETADKKSNTSSDTAGTINPGGEFIYDPVNGTLSSSYGVWGGYVNGAPIPDKNLVKGWYINYRWSRLEPVKDHFDWEYFDSQMKTAADNGFNIGFEIWTGPHCPEWIYTSGVARVETNTPKKLNTFPYYFDNRYKERYYNLLKVVSEHVQKLSPEIRNKIIFWMSAEGSTGDVTPYKGYPLDSKYNISEQQWFDYKKEVWTYLYKIGMSASPKINILVNQGEDGRYFDWLSNNLPKIWMKMGNAAQTYLFNGELEFYNRMQKNFAKTSADSTANRMRAEITPAGMFFSSNANWNMYALATSASDFGLDIFNNTPKSLEYTTDPAPFEFFNFYAGHKVANRSPGAFCVFRDALDIADTKRFPESIYGPVLDPAKTQQYKQALQTNSMKGEDEETGDENIKAANLKYRFANPYRLKKLLAEFAPYGAKNGSITDPEYSQVYASEDESNNGSGQQNTNKKNSQNNAAKQKKQQPGIAKSGKNADYGYITSFQKNRDANQVINDFGINLRPDNFHRFLVQYSPNTTSCGWWRVGPEDQPYGRYARAFESAKGITEMFFTLDKGFFNASTAPQKVNIKIIYLDKGNGAWSLNYYNGSGKTEAYKITCGNTGRWIIKTVSINAVFTQSLEHGTDLTMKYISGDNTIFNSIEVLR